ncbi:MAG TPA: alpha/beta hydrolase, partial [Chitinispirillaceae bacterium]|nr:alpha/beta hydrolase [Chitinispirillaceae bacterium]
MKPVHLIICSLCFFFKVDPVSAELSLHKLTSLSNAKIVHDSSIIPYLTYYGLDAYGSSHIIGTFKSDSFVCVGQIYRPCGPSRGTVIFLHGLFDHVGTNKNAIVACLQENYTFAAFDLPGHGLSSGKRGSIRDFREYADALGSFLKICDTLTSLPYVFIGHSTGCAVALEYLSSTKQQPFAKIVFLAPLLRSASFRSLSMGYKIFHNFRIIPRRWHRKSSHDKEAMKRFRNDPLQPKIFAVEWAGAYFSWFDRIKDMPEHQFPLVVIQGTDDKAVDWKYNLPWFEKKIKGVRVVK